MKRGGRLEGVISLSGALLLSSCTSGGSAPDPAPLPTYARTASGDGFVHEGSLPVDGAERRYRLFVPKDLPEVAPLVIVMHGTGGTPTQYAASLGYDAVAAHRRFLVAYPAGEHGSWNAGQALTYGANFDDVKFLVSLIDDVDALERVDRRRVYLTGHSSGGWMAYRAGCERSDVFAAVAPVGSALLVRCRPSRPLSVLHIQGEQDMNIPVSVAASSVEEMRKANGCSEPPVVTKASPVTLTRYAPCRGDSEVVLATIAGAGHDWPFGARGYSATEQGWEFFSRHVQP